MKLGETVLETVLAIIGIIFGMLLVIFLASVLVLVTLRAWTQIASLT